MNLETLDWLIIAAFFAVTMLIGLWASKKAGQSSKDFFLSGRDMPWWLLGVSMVATTFSADTPNLVTDIVRKNGVAGNWVWWAFLLTGMTTVFIYAKLWRRSGITTDLGFYELRYSGPEARFLRAFRAVYLGVFFNVMIMATVLLAGIKIAGIMLGLSPLYTVILVSLVTVVYSSMGGLRGVILTDFFQFALSMIGMVAAAVYIVQLPAIGGLEKLMASPELSGKTDFLPDFTDMSVAVPLFFVPIAVQWWSSWYPGAEPGGGGYVAQRMLSAKTERDATKATLFFNVAHYALRPWPWILIALASLIVFPQVADLKAQFPAISDDILADDLAFSAMLTFLPTGLLGLVIASLMAALMSTISTHLNWGASYLVHDFYARFFDHNPSEKRQVLVGRIATVTLMLLAAIFALFLTNAMQAFNILLQIGAGTGLLFLLRWFWWRINALSEIAAMLISLLVAVYFEVIYEGDLPAHYRLIIGVGLTTIGWLVATLVTRPTDTATLKSFYSLIRPHSMGWQPIAREVDTMVDGTVDSSLSTEILLVFVASIMVYALLFGTGYLLYGSYIFGAVSMAVAAFSAVVISRLWN